MRRSILLASVASTFALVAACSSSDDGAAQIPENDADTSFDVGLETTADGSADTITDSATDSGSDSADSTPDAPVSTAGWDPRFALPGLQGDNSSGVNAMIVTPKRLIYVGGGFHHAGSTPAAHVAVWNGLKWISIGDGLDGEVVGLAQTASEDIIAAVESSSSAGVTSELWLWNKTSWSKLGATFDGQVRSIDVGVDGTIWVGGSFTKVNAITVSGLARLKDATWTNGGFIKEGVEVVRATTTGACVGGGAEEGDFGVECWDGTKWESYKSNLAHGRVLALRIDSKGLPIAAGEFANAPDFPSSGSIARWNAETKKWDLIGGGVTGFVGGPGHVEDVVTYGDKVYVTGNFATAGALSVRNAAMWDGKKWWDLDGGLSKPWGVTIGDFSPAVTLAVDDGGEVYAGGGLTRAGSVNAFDIAHWDGASWTAVDDPAESRLGVNGSPETVAVASDGTAYVGGSFGFVGRDVAVSNIGRLTVDGVWHSLGAGLDSTVLGVATTATDVWAVGMFQGSGSTPTGSPLVSAKGVARWNGTTWSGVGGGVDAPAHAIQIAPDGKVWVGGEFAYAGTVETNGLAVWDGTKWSAVGGGLSGDSGAPARIAAIVIHDGKTYVGGEFVKAGSVDAKNIAVWNGATWSAVGSGFDASVDSLAWYADKLVAGGSFPDHLMTWDGTAWSTVGGGVHGEGGVDGDGKPYEGYANVYGLGTKGTDLFVTGMFSKAGATLSTRHLARFDGTNWSKIDGDIDDLGTDLFVASDALWLTGSFGSVAGKGSVGMGRWVFVK